MDPLSARAVLHQPLHDRLHRGEPGAARHQQEVPGVVLRHQRAARRPQPEAVADGGAPDQGRAHPARPGAADVELQLVVGTRRAAHRVLPPGVRQGRVLDRPVLSGPVRVGLAGPHPEHGEVVPAALVADHRGVPVRGFGERRLRARHHRADGEAQHPHPGRFQPGVPPGVGPVPDRLAERLLEGLVVDRPDTELPVVAAEPGEGVGEFVRPVQPLDQVLEHPLQVGLLELHGLREQRAQERAAAEHAGVEVVDELVERGDQGQVPEDQPPVGRPVVAVCTTQRRGHVLGRGGEGRRRCEDLSAQPHGMVSRDQPVVLGGGAGGVHAGQPSEH